MVFMLAIVAFLDWFAWERIRQGTNPSLPIGQLGFAREDVADGLSERYPDLLERLGDPA
jgi:hypothetical protein